MVVDTGLLVVVAAAHIKEFLVDLVEDLVVHMLVVDQAERHLDLELQQHKILVLEEVDMDHMLLEIVRQATVVPVSSSSLTHHKYLKNSYEYSER